MEKVKPQQDLGRILFDKIMQDIQSIDDHFEPWDDVEYTEEELNEMEAMHGQRL